MFNDTKKLNYLVSLKRREEQIRKGGIPAERHIKDFSYFGGLRNNADFHAAYKNMQGKYVLNVTDEIDIADALNMTEKLRDNLIRALT